MPEFKLPSGRVVETREPTWGEEVHAISTGLADPESFTWAKFAVVVPGLSLEEIKALNRKDGRALMEEVNQIWQGRSEEAEIPFANGLP